MDQRQFWYLENIDATNIFCPKKLGEDTQNHTDREFKKGEYVYMPEEFADKLYLITTGRIKIGNHSDSGKEITKAILGPGEVFGELSIIGESKRRDFAQAIESTSLCVISVSEMQSLMKEHSALNLFMMKIIGSRVLEMENRLQSLIFKDSRTRIVEFIKDLAERKGQRVGYEVVVRKMMTHQQIANLTATSRQTVTTVLNDLRNKNILTFNRRRLLIRDMEKLDSEVHTGEVIS